MTRLSMKLGLFAHLSEAPPRDGAPGFTAFLLSVSCLLCETSSCTITECGLSLPSPPSCPQALEMIESDYWVRGPWGKCPHNCAGLNDPPRPDCHLGSEWSVHWALQESPTPGARHHGTAWRWRPHPRRSEPSKGQVNTHRACGSFHLKPCP